MEVVRQPAVKQGSTDGSGTEDEDFQRVGVFSSEAEGGGVLVMKLVDATVEGAVMEGLMRDVVPCVFHYEEECDLEGHGLHVGEGDLVGVHVECDGERVEGEDLRNETLAWGYTPMYQVAPGGVRR